jgi:predicted pyridoxine 5'-phosphate oxidase superfamily flavin-nucleotide-binding protein
MIRCPLALLLLTALAAATAGVAAEPSARDLRAAECVAALDAHTHELAKQVREGRDTLRPLLLDRLVAGSAFVGDAYLRGDSDEQEARGLTDQMREAQKRLPPSELAARQAACADEGAKLYAEGNALQRAVVKRLAKRRMDKLLGA